MAEQSNTPPAALTDEQISAIHEIVDEKIRTAQADAPAAPSIEDIGAVIQEKVDSIDWDQVAIAAKAKADQDAQDQAKTRAAENAKANAKAEKAKAKAEDDAVAARSAKEASARERFVAMVGPDAPRIPLDLSSLDDAVLLLDNGTTFSIDFQKSIAAKDLRVIDGRAVRLEHKLSIGADMERPFIVRGLTLAFSPTEVLRCELTTPLTIGAGRKAELPAQSVLFRMW